MVGLKRCQAAAPLCLHDAQLLGIIPAHASPREVVPDLNFEPKAGRISWKKFQHSDRAMAVRTILRTGAADVASQASENMKQAAIDGVWRDCSSHGSAADISLSREDRRRVFSVHTSNKSRRAAVNAAPKQTLTPREERAFLILNRAMEYLMDRVPMGGPDTVLADIQHSDIQAAAILARASRELFVPTMESLSQNAPRVNFRARLREMATHLGLLHEGKSARVIPFTMK
jgi:hypothetical protein